MTSSLFGVLPIDKPGGQTSRDVCNKIARLIRPHKVGHTGTLDPLATGVLLLAIGSAARLVEFSLGHDKEYEAEFWLGKHSDTLDIEGVVNELSCPPIPSREAIEREATKWIGEVEQVPPRYSAINVGGKRAYNLARKGRDFELPARKIQVQTIELLDYAYPRLKMRIVCGSGTYVRSLGSDIARGLGTDAIMSRLTRTRIGPIRLDQCASIDELSSIDRVAAVLQPPQTLIANMPMLQLHEAYTTQLRNGIPVQLDGQSAARLSVLDQCGNLVAVVRRCTPDDGRWGQTENLYRSLRVFQQASDTSQPNAMSTPQSPES